MIRVGLIDSGIDPGLRSHVAAIAAFTGAPLSADELGHGTTVARLVLSHAPDAGLLVAQAFCPRARATPERVAGALDWLRRERACLVNLSLGVARDPPVLRAAVEAALGAGIVLIASTPARGAPALPAAYPGVIRVTGGRPVRAGRDLEAGRRARRLRGLHDSEVARIEAAEAGADGYVPKAEVTEQLVRVLGDLIDDARGEEEK